jgi:ribosomal protein S18 acetylase RimI-like enzyme
LKQAEILSLDFLEKWHDVGPMHFVPAAIPAKLSDGSELLLREVTVDDRERAMDAFDRLSAGDVAMRFWRDLIAIDDDLLDRLTSADQINHIVWCAINPDRLEDPGYGAGSVWRLKTDPSVGEISITVLPDYQGRGLGVVLFSLLWVLSRLLGMETLRANVLNANIRALSWFKRLGGEVHSQGAFYEIDFSLCSQVQADSRIPCQVDLAHWVEFFQEQFSGAE